MAPKALPNTSSHHNLVLLCSMRSVHVCMQILAIAAVAVWGSFALPLQPLSLIILLEIVVTGLSWWRANYLKRNQQTLLPAELLVQVLFDVAALTLLIYFTGGGMNPFTGFFVVPVIVAAISLSRQQSWVVIGISIASYIGLALMPQSHVDHAAHMALMESHRYGMLLGFIITAVLIGLFVSRLAANLLLREKQLYLAQQQARASEQINALGMLAAGAAHELGTPLNTLALIEAELRAEVSGADDLLDNHKKQLSRCKRSLEDLMAVSGGDRAAGAAQVVVHKFLEELCERWNRGHSKLSFDVDINTGEATAVVDNLFEKAIVNLLDNAAVAASSSVKLAAQLNGEELLIQVQDDGIGIADEVVLSLDEPAGLGATQFGFGLFWVKAFAVRMDGELSFLKPAAGGTYATLKLPLTVAGL